jgi:hypothetical protein
MSALDLFDDTVAPSERPSLQDGARIHMNTTCNALCIDDKAPGFFPGRVEIRIFRYPWLKNFFHNCLITNDLKAAKGWLSPLQAAFSSETCFSSRQPSIFRIWI